MGQWSEAGKGAAGGAATGAAIGSVIPGWGTAVGGIVGGVAGGLAGYFGNQGNSGYEEQLKRLAAQYSGRAINDFGPAQQAGASQFRQNQAALISQLEAQARGEGPSAAQIQMREAMDRAAGAQASAAAGAGGRGVNSGAALRQAMNNTAAIQAQGARDTATMRAQEQLAATGQLGGAINQGRSADEMLSQFNAQQMNAQARAKLEAQMQLLGINDKSQLEALFKAMSVQGPSTGTQLMAGGAQLMPSLVQRLGTPGASSTPGQAPQGA